MERLFFDPALADKPYGSAQESWHDLLCYADLMLIELCQRSTPQARFGRLPQLPVDPEELADSLAERRLSAGVQVDEEFRAALLRAQLQLQSRTEATEDADCIPFERVCSAFALTPLRRTMLLLSLCPFFDRKYAGLYALLCSDRRTTAPSFGTAVAACGLAQEVPPQEIAGFYAGDEEFRMLFALPDSGLEPDTPLLPHPGLVQEAGGGRGLDAALAPFCALYDWEEPLEKLIFRAALGRELTAMIRRIDAEGVYAAPRALLLQGPEGSGRLFLLRHVMQSLHLDLLTIDFQRFPDADESRLAALLLALERQVMLRPTLLCLQCGGCGPHDPRARLEVSLIEGIAAFAPLFFLTAEPEGCETVHQARLSVLDLPLPAPGYSEAAGLLAQYAAGLPVDEDIDFAGIASRYTLLPGQVCRALEFARMLAYREDSPRIGEQEILGGLAACRTNSMSALGEVLPVQYTMADLIVSDDNRAIMKLAISHIKCRTTVRETWGMDKKNAYGHGVCILFYGPPGTGKTMAAQVLAHEVGMDLFRVDSSQLTSKYIGETSKNMRQLFDSARGSNVILFFDEADSIFGRRTSASDANDRYANSDTAFLLQKIEEYDGMVILATNLLQNIDEAFRRRITYMVNLPLPDRTLRERMWREMVPDQMPTEALDFAFLSKFELAGSGIKSVLISAAYMAAAEGGTVNMQRVLRALQIFMAKQGKNLLQVDLMPYGSQLEN